MVGLAFGAWRQYVHPVAEYKRVRLPQRRHTRSVAVEWVDGAVRRHVLDLIAELEALGFEVADVLLIEEDESPTVEYAVVLRGPTPETVGLITLLCLGRNEAPIFRFCQLNTVLDDGTQLLTKNSSATAAHRDLGQHQMWVVPEAVRCDELLKIHQLRVAQRSARPVPAALTDGAKFHTDDWLGELDALERHGHLGPVAADGFHTYTWRGAFSLASTRLWPFNRLRERKRLADVYGLLPRPPTSP